MCLSLFAVRCHLELRSCQKISLADANGAKDIQELCDEYYIETRHIEKLNELMKDRP
jgi:hypothetical protein